MSFDLVGSIVQFSGSNLRKFLLTGQKKNYDNRTKLQNEFFFSNYINHSRSNTCRLQQQQTQSFYIELGKTSQEKTRFSSWINGNQQRAGSLQFQKVARLGGAAITTERTFFLTIQRALLVLNDFGPVKCEFFNLQFCQLKLLIFYQK